VRCRCCAFSNGADMGDADVPHDAMAVSLMFEMGLKAKDFGRLNEGTIKNEREVWMWKQFSNTTKTFKRA
jgi:hypothetical protein